MLTGMPVSDAIRRLLTLDPFWSTMDPRNRINGGNCESFMLDVRKLVPGAEERTTGPFLGDDDEEIAGPFDHVGHYWIFFAGRHYDAEAPHGVERMEDLPIFARSCARATYGMAPGMLPDP